MAAKLVRHLVFSFSLLLSIMSADTTTYLELPANCLELCTKAAASQWCSRPIWALLEDRGAVRVPHLSFHTTKHRALEEGGRHLQSCKNDAAPIMYWRTEAPRHFCNSCTASDTRFVVLYSSVHRPASWIPFVDMLFPSYPMFLCPSDSLVFLFPPPLSLSYTLSLSLSVCACT